MPEEVITNSPILYLVPAPLVSDQPSRFYGEFFFELLDKIRLFIVEDERSARRNLRNMGFKGSFDTLPMMVLNEHSPRTIIPDLIQAVTEHRTVALMSDAGLPAMADPGEELVRAAHKAGIRVIPLPGPSSVFLALIASGLNAEQFSFHGYLPVKENERIRRLKQLEQTAGNTGYTQIFMETPYRNQQMVESLLKVLQADTLLCIAADITSPSEEIRTMSVAEWKKKPPEVNRRLCVFLIGR
jgi:16S rRNA (cytidine1402-2'-O)-methyltransferase